MSVARKIRKELRETDNTKECLQANRRHSFCIITRLQHVRAKHEVRHINLVPQPVSVTFTEPVYVRAMQHRCGRNQKASPHVVRACKEIQSQKRLKDIRRRRKRLVHALIAVHGLKILCRFATQIWQKPAFGRFRFYLKVVKKTRRGHMD